VEPTVFDTALVARYDRPGPRYTSYPTALEFSPGFASADLARALADSPRGSLSLYLHVPFCASPCFYCGCNKVITRDVTRARAYVARLEREIEMRARLFPTPPRVEQLHFGGGTPTFLEDGEIGRLLERLAATFPFSPPGEREFSIEVDPRTVDGARLARLGRLGFDRLSLGVQDFDPAVQAAVNRVQSADATLALIGEARAAGFRSVSVDLIYGLPRQTRASFARTLEQIAAARPDRLAVYGYAHLPALFKPQRRIRAEELPAPADKLALLGLTVATLSAAGYVYIGMDHFALPTDELVRAQEAGSLQRNFQGYSTRAELDLLGLGVSAISNLGGAYAQNLKSLPAWSAAIDEGRSPSERGLRLSADDRLRRFVIQRLMCATRLDFAAVEAAHDIVFEEYFARELAALAPLVSDGLVLAAGRSLAITPVGRLLMRNVAMVFDRYLGDRRERYSRAV
jgi:oxygen-independent coproporphyrinogen III oxidase